MATESAATASSQGEGQIPARLEAARRRFDEWRATRAKIGPIPEELWSEAASCAARYGTFRTARVLGLDGGKLKRRGKARKTGEKKKKTAARRPRFVEVAPAPPPVPASSGCVLELESGAGTRLRIQLRDTPLAQVAELARSLIREDA